MKCTLQIGNEQVTWAKETGSDTLCVAQTCERKNCTVYCTRGTTLVRVTTVDEQVARQRLGQRWFITLRIAVHIQGLYTVYNGAGV